VLFRVLIACLDAGLVILFPSFVLSPSSGLHGREASVPSLPTTHPQPRPQTCSNLRATERFIVEGL
jgi:hypothetical protein